MRYPYVLVCWLLVLMLPVCGWGFDVKGSLNVTGSQVIAGPVNHGVSATGTDAYEITLVPAITAYTAGACYSFTADVANGTEATLAVNGLSALPIQKLHAGSLVGLLENDISAGGIVHVCYDGTVFQCRNCTGALAPDAGNATTGIETSATELLKVRPEVSELSGAQTLCRHHTIMATVGANGANFTLPSAADTTCAGWFKVIIADTGAGFLTLTPTGADLINDINSPTVPITGRRSSQTCERTGDTGWVCTEMSRAGLGEIVASSCTGAGGSTNTSSSGSGAYVTHTLTCEIPAGYLKTGTVIESCSIFQVFTGATAPNLFWDLRINSTTALAGNSTSLNMADNIAGQSARLCFETVIGIQSGSNWVSYTAPQGNFSAINNATDSNVVDQPINIPVAGSTLFQFRTQWDTAGVGTNTIQQIGMSQRISR